MTYRRATSVCVLAIIDRAWLSRKTVFNGPDVDMLGLWFNCILIHSSSHIECGNDWRSSRNTEHYKPIKTYKISSEAYKLPFTEFGLDSNHVNTALWNRQYVNKSSSTVNM